MSDDFYNAFDRECFLNASNPERRQDYRSVFQQDLGRILFTGAFRRLQAKTQVFQAGEYDFYRTRLTHSLDVSSVAESIAVWLKSSHPEVEVDFHLLKAICLAHDIGHPPFGHAGERVLNEIMSEYGRVRGQRADVANTDAHHLQQYGNPWRNEPQPRATGRPYSSTNGFTGIAARPRIILFMTIRRKCLNFVSAAPTWQPNWGTPK